nr:unnamed protein product [Callosobruchus analis]
MKEQDKVFDMYEQCSVEFMANAAEEEKEMAIRDNEVGEDGVPEITVICDGTWGNRSYKKNYNSLSGAAAIIGYRTKKVLYLGVKNKYCVVCRQHRGENVPDHTCYKNWTGSSSAMESAIISERFSKSESMYGLRLYPVYWRWRQ